MLTLQEKATYRFIIDYIQTHQSSPTTQEIAQAIGITSKGTAPVSYTHLTLPTKRIV